MARRRTSLGMAVGLLAISTASFAKDPPPSPLMKELEGCRSIADASKRLACFDRVSGTLVGAAAKGDVVLVDRGQMRQARRSLFGFSLPKLPFFDGDKSADDQADELQSTITSLRSLPYGKFQFRIADGNALWETTEASSAVTPRNGDKVLIKRGALGSYIVKFGGSRAVKAKRVG